MGCLVTCVGVDGEEESPEAFLDLVKKRMPPGEVDGFELGEEESLDEDLKMPLKLIRRGERGGDSWYGKGKTVLGDPGLYLVLTGADNGLDGWFWRPRGKKLLEGLPVLQGSSALRWEFFSALSKSPSKNGIAKELRSGMWTLSIFFLWPEGFLGRSFFFLVSMTVLPML